MENYFAKMAAIDVKEHIEKKGQFSYLSWAWAVDQLRRNDPEATWEVKRFDGMPYMETKLGYFVEVAVTVKGITLSQIHPVLDGRNRPIQTPNPFDINTSIQRCLVKAIALHGLGLYIYSGEDLPPDENGDVVEDIPVTGSKEKAQDIGAKKLEEQKAKAAYNKQSTTALTTESLQKDIFAMLNKKGMSFPDLNEFASATLNRKVGFFKKDVVTEADLLKVKNSLNGDPFEGEGVPIPTDDDLPF